MNTLHFGDNLDVLREDITSNSVDLVYLDPPFNSARGYNVLFKEHDAESEAQIHAFEDTWRWDKKAEQTWKELTDTDAEERGVPAKLVTLMESLRPFLGQNDMLAYLTMMAIRLVELRRVLKETGSLYLHCDPTASHYLKLVLDAIFGVTQFRSEIIWKRTQAHNSAHRYGPVHDVILYYVKTDAAPWHAVYQPYDAEYLKKFNKVDDKTGKRFQDVTLTGPGTREGDSGLPWRGFNPTDQGRHWQPASYVYDKYRRMTAKNLADVPLLERFEKLDEVSLIYWPKKAGGQPRYKFFVEDAPGVPVQDVWTDIDPINSQADEDLGYQTQKPVALLERIIAASSSEGDVVLDPFCGCGTTIHAAQRMKRKWIGIDVTHLAIGLISDRINKAFPGIQYDVHGVPADTDGARRLADTNPYGFQWWALFKIGARPVGDGGGGTSKRDGKKGKDRGIDGVIRFRDDPRSEKSHRIIVSVKAGKNISPSMVRDLVGTLDAEGAPLGVLFTMHDPTAEMRVAATKAGCWHSETWGRDYDRIQIITVSEAFAGKSVEYPGKDVTWQAAPVDQKRTETLSLPGVHVPPTVSGKKRRK